MTDMTIDDAILILDCERPYGNGGCGANDEEVEIAINMAIKALEQAPRQCGVGSTFGNAGLSPAYRQKSKESKERKMRNIAEIIEDDRNGKQLSQTERRIAVAYIQGKYDALRELKIVNNSNTNEVLDKIRAEIEQVEINGYVRDVECFRAGLNTASKIIDKYNEKVEDKE